MPHRTRHWALLFAIAVAAVVVGGRPALAQDAPAEAEPEYVIIKLRTAEPMRAAGATPSLAEQGYRQMEVPEGMTADQYLAELRARPDVESAEPDVRVEAALVPNDPFYGPEQANYLNSIGAPVAWDLEPGGEEVVVAVIDSGLDTSHPEFAGRMWVNTAEVSGNGLDDDLNGCTDDINGCRYVNLTSINQNGCGYTSGQPTGNIGDDHGAPGSGSHSHGTTVTGIAAATGNNGLGVAGIAWDVTVMPIKVLDCGPGFPFGNGQPGGSMFNVAQGVNYAVRHGADVINLSLSSQNGDADIQAMRDALLDARDAGVVVVIAAGNDGASGNPSVGYPAAYAALSEFSNVVAVAATNPSAGNGRASFSSYGPAITIAAPGVNIAGTARLAMAGGGYGEQSGTSVASPIVAGLFALLKSRNPSLTVDEMVELVTDSATAVPSPNSPPNWAGAGLVSIGASVSRIPLFLDGAALHDWKDVPAGSNVQAVISGAVCGQATAISDGLVTTFSMEVQADAVVPGCGAPGRSVSVVISVPGSGSATAQPLLPWPPRAEWLVAVQDFSTVTPPWGAIVNQPLGSGWSNIGQLANGGSLPGAVGDIPPNWLAIYRWDPVGLNPGGTIGEFDRYVRNGPSYASSATTVARYDAFWVDASGSSVTTINPCISACPRSIDLQAGWNNFVYTAPTAPASAALAALDGNYLQVLRYDNSGGDWESYLPGLPRYLNEFEALIQMNVYWIYLEAPASLSLP